MLTMSREDADLSAALRGGAQGYPAEGHRARGAGAGARGGAVRATTWWPARWSARWRVWCAATAARSRDAAAPAAPFSELTPRELEILEHVADGLSNKMIARALEITDGTVKLHVKAILRKLGMRSRVEAAVSAVEHGLGKYGRKSRAAARRVTAAVRRESVALPQGARVLTNNCVRGSPRSSSRNSAAVRQRRGSRDVDIVAVQPGMHPRSSDCNAPRTAASSGSAASAVNGA